MSKRRSSLKKLAMSSRDSKPFLSSSYSIVSLSSATRPRRSVNMEISDMDPILLGPV